MLPFFGILLPKGFTISIADRSIGPLVADPQDAFAGYRLATDGIAYSRSGPVISVYGAIASEWLVPANATEADLYECFATLNSGTLTSGTTGSWLALTADRTWTVDRTTIGINSAQITVQIRLIGTTATLDSAVITMSAEVTT